MAESDPTKAPDCTAKGLSVMEGLEVPLAGSRDCGRLHQRMKSSELLARRGQDKNQTLS
jgi:hypothetical protein